MVREICLQSICAGRLIRYGQLVLMFSGGPCHASSARSYPTTRLNQGEGTSSQHSLGDFHVISALAQVFDGSVWLHLFWRGWTPFTDVSPSWRHTGSHQIQSTGQTMMSMKVSGSGKASGRGLQIYRTCCIDEFQSSDTIDANGIRTIVEYKTNEEGKRVKVRTPILYFTPAL